MPAETSPEAAAPPLPDFHLTARPWKPSGISRDACLDAVEELCRFFLRHQAADGAIIDPFLKREHQYATPYFAAATGVLMRLGRARETWDHGIRAMDHATACFARGGDGIPDRHGEFFDAALAGALESYEGRVPAEKMRDWRERMKTPRDRVIQGPLNNWRAYAMRGEWLRAGLGLVDRDCTLAFIEDSWLRAGQRDRIASDPWNLYQDRETDPESHAVEAVGRGNLLGLIAAGYDGRAAAEITRCVERGTAATLLLQDPSGQCPPNGRADNHVWNDVLCQLAFEIMAGRAARAGRGRLAGQYRRAAMLAFQSSRRWLRRDGPWRGSHYVTKNRFDPALRVGYQAASNYANYNGAVLLHLAEACLARQDGIAECPAPAEIGGYAFATGEAFATASANAGGMQLFAALRGDTAPVYGHYWTALGVVRLGRAGWDTRLGPSDGIRDFATRRGVTFAPTWREGGHWVRMADVPERYRGHFSVQFTHPLLVRCAIDYRPLPGQDGPRFRHEFILTPDGILATLRTDAPVECGVTWPLLENDGEPLRTSLGDGLATTAGASGDDQQCFLLPGEDARISAREEPLLGSYGWLRPLRATTGSTENRTFVYPRGAGDPAAAAVRENFRVTPDGFTSPLGWVRGPLYAGRTSAGGEGTGIDCDGDGRAAVEFDEPCRFVLQRREGRIVAVECDRAARVRIGGRTFSLQPFSPLAIG